MENQEVLTPSTVTRMALATVPATPADIVLYAMQNGGSIEQIRDFMQLQREWEADQARKSYVADMAEFKKNPPHIVKDKQVAFSGTSYMHATLGNVTSSIVEGLARHGFSHRWDTDQQPGGLIAVTCILTHRLGHSEKTLLSAKGDDSGKKNNIQQMASSITYLQRYTLLAACGLATHDQGDDDGHAAGIQGQEDWLGHVARAKSLDELQRIWNDGSVDLKRSDDLAPYDDFKCAVNAKKATLGGAPAKAGRSSRLSDIVGKAQPDQGAAA